MTNCDPTSIASIAQKLFEQGLRLSDPDLCGPGQSLSEAANPAGLYPESQAKPGSPPTPSYYFLTASQQAISPNIATETPEESRFSQAAAPREDFPIFNRTVNSQPLIWLDNAATTQKPQAVLDAMDQFYRNYNSNVHRGAHSLAQQATTAYETARTKVQQLLNAASPAEIIFVRGATEAINLVAQTYGRTVLHRGDEIILTQMEHHSNIVPWQIVQQATGALIQVIPLNDRGQLLLAEYERLLSPRTRIVALTQVSNVLGTINPVRTMAAMAHAYNAAVLVDGAQAVAHFPVDVRELDADFYVFSGHKLYGPTGIGVLYGKRAFLEALPPWQGGGSMIKEVSFERTVYNTLPQKFEAGTANIAGAVGLGAAVDYLQKIGLPQIEQYERELTGYTQAALQAIPGCRLFGAAPHKIGVFSWLMTQIPPDQLARRLDQAGIAVRVGHHCAQPLMRRYGVNSTVRAALGLYNTKEEIDKLVETIAKAAPS
ncbi:MAG: cysteine desulfurase [Bacillota bacterium]|jgi:cysteine desulfurase/selenocysteine lyase